MFLKNDGLLVTLPITDQHWVFGAKPKSDMPWFHLVIIYHSFFENKTPLLSAFLVSQSIRTSLVNSIWPHSPMPPHPYPTPQKYIFWCSKHYNWKKTSTGTEQVSNLTSPACRANERISNRSQQLFLSLCFGINSVHYSFVLIICWSSHSLRSKFLWWTFRMHMQTRFHRSEQDVRVGWG